MSVMNGATITIQQGSTMIAALTADINGQANCTLPQGTYQVTIAKTGYVTTIYQIVISADNTSATFNLPAQPLKSSPALMTEQIAENMIAANNVLITEQITDAISVVNTPVISETITDSLNALNSTVASESMTEAATAGANPSTWQLIILLTFDDPTLPNGQITPNGNLGENNQVSTTATTKQYSIYNYEIIDGIIVNNNSATTSEAPNTNHSYIIPNQTKGTIHIFTVKFRAAWELNTNASGSGTVNPSGTMEVADGSGISAAGTPNSSINMGDGHTQIFYLDHWTLDGQVVSSGSVPAQPKGTSHSLIAVFGSYFSPPY